MGEELLPVSGDEQNLDDWVGRVEEASGFVCQGAGMYVCGRDLIDALIMNVERRET